MANSLTTKKVISFLTKENHRKKLYDGHGLFLLNKNGRGYWQIKYQFFGKEKVYSVGTYPDISLAHARSQIPYVKNLVKEGKDPVLQRKLDRISNYQNQHHPFKELALEWCNLNLKRGRWQQVHYDKSLRALERDIFPDIGRRPQKEWKNLRPTDGIFKPLNNPEFPRE